MKTMGFAMCFSATASFVTSAALFPVGLYSVSQAVNHDRRYLLLASFPLLFSVQQGFEGALWLQLEGNTSIPGQAMASGFLFFAYFLWPFIVPLAALLVEVRPVRRRIFAVFALIGALYGLLLYVPLLVNDDWLTYRLVFHSIVYEPKLVYDELLPSGIERSVYAMIVAVPLLFSSVDKVRLFGLLVLASVVVTAAIFAYAFVSIWCFFAALLSIHVLQVVRHETRVTRAYPW